MPDWTEDKNQRRCELIDKDIDGVLTPDEAEELEQLQQELYATRSPMLQQQLTALREMQSLITDLAIELSEMDPDEVQCPDCKQSIAECQGICRKLC